MVHIVVNDDQAKLISESAEPVEICNVHGQCLGHVVRTFTPEDIAIAQERAQSDEPRYTTQQVLAYLRSLAPQ